MLFRKYADFDPKIFKMGYIILYKNNGNKFGNLIGRQQLRQGFSKENSKFSHVEISGGGIHSINTSPPISKLVEITKTHKGRYARLVRYKDQEYRVFRRYKVAYFSATLCNKKYDFLGVTAFVIKWIKQNNRLFFCSEGVLWSLRKEFPNILEGITPETCMPAHFTTEEFETVWEGIIN